jgi:hypothetical protein
MRIDDDNLSMLVARVRERINGGMKFNEAVNTTLKEKYRRPLTPAETSSLTCLIFEAMESDFNTFLENLSSRGSRGTWSTGRISGSNRFERIGFSNRDLAAGAEAEDRRDAMNQ